MRPVTAQDIARDLELGRPPATTAHLDLYRWGNKLGRQGPRPPSIQEQIATAPSLEVVEVIMGNLRESGLGDNRARRRWVLAAAARIKELSGVADAKA